MIQITDRIPSLWKVKNSNFSKLLEDTQTCSSYQIFLDFSNESVMNRNNCNRNMK